MAKIKGTWSDRERFKVRQIGNQVQAGGGGGGGGGPSSLFAGPTFSAHKNAVNQTLPDSVFTLVTFGTASWNTGTCWNTGSSRFTPNLAGKYLLLAQVSFQLAPFINADLIVSLYKNGVELRRADQIDVLSPAPGGTYSLSLSTLSDANGSTDYFEVFAFQNGGSAQSINGNTAYSWVQAAVVIA